MSKKDNNRHAYPMANHQPRHKAAERIGKAEARTEFSNGLSLEQKIARLPPEPHSAKERTRLLAALATQNAPKETTTQAEVVYTEVLPEGMTKKQARKYMKGSL